MKKNNNMINLYRVVCESLPRWEAVMWEKKQQQQHTDSCVLLIFLSMSSYEFMNEGSLRSYQSSKSLATAWEAGHSQRCSGGGGAGCCQSGFTGFDSAGSPLSTNHCRRSVWLLPLVVGPLVIIILQAGGWKSLPLYGGSIKKTPRSLSVSPRWAKGLGCSWNTSFQVISFSQKSRERTTERHMCLLSGI